MVRVTFRETRERGIYITGDYERTTREIEFEGSTSEVSRLIASASATLMLPGIEDPRLSLLSSGRGSKIPNLREIMERM